MIFAATDLSSATLAPLISTMKFPACSDGHLRSLDKPEVLEMMVHIALSPHADNLSGIAATQERQRHRLARRARAAGPADGALHNHRIAHDDSNQC